MQGFFQNFVLKDIVITYKHVPGVCFLFFIYVQGLNLSLQVLECIYPP